MNTKAKHVRCNTNNQWPLWERLSAGQGGRECGRGKKQVVQRIADRVIGRDRDRELRRKLLVRDGREPVDLSRGASDGHSKQYQSVRRQTELVDDGAGVGRQACGQLFQAQLGQQTSSNTICENTVLKDGIEGAEPDEERGTEGTWLVDSCEVSSARDLAVAQW